MTGCAGKARARSTGTTCSSIARVAANNIVRCHVECKNYTRKLQLADVADKILQTQTYWQTKQIDYFLIVTPRAGISDELDILSSTGMRR